MGSNQQVVELGPGWIQNKDKPCDITTSIRGQFLFPPVSKGFVLNSSSKYYPAYLLSVEGRFVGSLVSKKAPAAATLMIPNDMPTA